jgi:hypothetical protein
VKKFSLHNPKNSFVLSLLAWTLVSTTCRPSPVHALPWKVDPGTSTDNGLAISGSFSIANEISASPLLITSDVTVAGLIFRASDAIVSSTVGFGVTAIDWVDNANNLLSFVFDTPLTTAGGTIFLDSTVSSFTPFLPGNPLAISGSLSQVPGPLPILGAGTALAWSRQLKRRNAPSKRAGHSSND